MKGGNIKHGLTHKEGFKADKVRGETDKKAQMPTAHKGSVSTDRGKFKYK